MSGVYVTSKGARHQCGGLAYILFIFRRDYMTIYYNMLGKMQWLHSRVSDSRTRNAYVFAYTRVQILAGLS